TRVPHQVRDDDASRECSRMFAVTIPRVTRCPKLAKLAPQRVHGCACARARGRRDATNAATLLSFVAICRSFGSDESLTMNQFGECRKGILAHVKMPKS